MTDPKAFFAELIDREEQIAALKAEHKEAIESYASCNNLTSKGIAKAVKEYKAYLKDQAQYKVVNEDAFNLFDQLVGEG